MSGDQCDYELSPEQEAELELEYRARLLAAAPDLLAALVGADRRAARASAIADWKCIDTLPIPVKIAENPGKGALSKAFRRPDQIVHPYMLGDDASKETGLWLWNTDGIVIPPPTEWIQPRYVDGRPRWANQTDAGQNRVSPSDNRWQERSKTYDGIADALAAALVRPFAERLAA